MSKEEYLEQQAAAKKKAQVGGALVAGCAGGGERACSHAGVDEPVLLTLLSSKLVALHCGSMSFLTVFHLLRCAVPALLCSMTARRSWSGAAA